MKELQKIKIDFGTSPNFENIKNTIANFFISIIIIENKLGDGFQISDLFALMQVEPKVRDIVDTMPLFLNELKQLEPSVSIPAIDAARDETFKTKSFGKVASSSYFMLRGFAASYHLAGVAYLQGLEAKINFDNAFNGTSANKKENNDIA